jgi:hypothetical protein
MYGKVNGAGYDLMVIFLIRTCMETCKVRAQWPQRTFDDTMSIVSAAPIWIMIDGGMKL